MNKLYYVILAIFLLAVGIFYFTKGSNVDNIKQIKELPVSNINIKNDPSFALVTSVEEMAIVINSEGKEIALKSGDKIYSGETVKTNKTGKVILQMQDKSELRLAGNTVFVLDVIENSNDGQVLLGSLNIGKVWSKVKSLLSSHSKWELRTSDTVATVRGTSFGLEKVDKKTRLVVTESVVAIKNNQQDAKDLLVKAGEYIDREEGKAFANTSTINKEMYKDSWLAINLNKDNEWDKTFNSSNERQQLNNSNPQSKDLLNSKTIPTPINDTGIVKNSEKNTYKTVKSFQFSKKISSIKYNSTGFTLPTSIIYSDGTEKDVSSETKYYLSSDTLGKMSGSNFLLNLNIINESRREISADFEGEIKAVWVDTVTGKSYTDINPFVIDVSE